MRFILSACLILITAALQGQNLPANPQTGLVWVHDSVETGGSNLQEVKDHLARWGQSLLDIGNLKSIYKLNSTTQQEAMFVSLPIGSVVARELGGNKFSVSGTLMYSREKKTAFLPIVTAHGVKFSFIYTIRANNLSYEFTNLEYSHDMILFGKYEEEKPPKFNQRKSSSAYNNSTSLVKMSNKEWLAVRQEYYAHVQLLANNLKTYIGNLVAGKPIQAQQSQVNYTSYQAIKTGMTYDELKRLLKDEGKELSSGTVQVDGKNVAQQVVAWYDLDNTKSITVTFVEGKVVSKSQTKL